MKNCRMIALLLALAASVAPAADPSSLRPIGSIGKAERVLKADSEAVLFEHEGKGCLSHFWFGGNFKGVEQTRIRYYADIAGLTHFDKATRRFSAYRFHDDDPIFFQEGLRLTCRCGETEHGTPSGPVAYKAPPPTRYTTYAWIYRW